MNNLPGRPFKVDVSQMLLDDLADRLRRTRFPSQEIDAGWKYGPPLDYARRLHAYWLDSFDWRAWERRINSFAQRIVTIDGQDIHVLIEPGSGSKPLPLVLTHGWPGSFIEMLDLIEPLAHPERFGGREEDAFTVILPSLPGYGFSPAPRQPMTTSQIAALWSRLMRDQFGFERYGAQGSDWGSIVTARLGLDYSGGLVGIHLNGRALMPSLDSAPPPLSTEEAAWLERSAAGREQWDGYQRIQATKPQSLAYGQTDSPIGLACWIVEKFQGWTAAGCDDDPPFDMGWMIANIMLYWINGSNAPAWLYLTHGGDSGRSIPAHRKIEVPTGFTLFPNEPTPPPPRSLLERGYDVRHYRVAPSGGHFPAMENTKFLVDEIQSFFRELAAVGK